MKAFTAAFLPGPLSGMGGIHSPSPLYKMFSPCKDALILGLFNLDIFTCVYMCVHNMSWEQQKAWKGGLATSGWISLIVIALSRACWEADRVTLRAIRPGVVMTSGFWLMVPRGQQSTWILIQTSISVILGPQEAQGECSPFTRLFHRGHHI